MFQSVLSLMLNNRRPLSNHVMSGCTGNLKEPAPPSLPPVAGRGGPAPVRPCGVSTSSLVALTCCWVNKTSPGGLKNTKSCLLEWYVRSLDGQDWPI